MNGDTPEKPVAPPESQWQYNPGSETSLPPEAPQQFSSPRATTEVTWTASEFVEHDKHAGWYVALALLTLVLDVVLYFWTKDFISITAVTIMAVLFGVLAGRKPRVLDYSINNRGITIGSKTYPFATFKSFTVIDEGAFSSISFLPLQRFMPPIAIYYDPKDADKIVLALSQYLPMERRNHDVVDRMARRVRF